MKKIFVLIMLALILPITIAGDTEIETSMNVIYDNGDFKFEMEGKEYNFTISHLNSTHDKNYSFVFNRSIDFSKELTEIHDDVKNMTDDCMNRWGNCMASHAAKEEQLKTNCLEKENQACYNMSLLRDAKTNELTSCQGINTNWDTMYKNLNYTLSTKLNDCELEKKWWLIIPSIIAILIGIAGYKKYVKPPAGKMPDKEVPDDPV